MTVNDSYYNMTEQICPAWRFWKTWNGPCRKTAWEPHSHRLRGGTDGARFSFMGLPCPNICTGGNAHGKTEYVVLEDMEKIKDIIKTAIYNVE